MPTDDPTTYWRAADVLAAQGFSEIAEDLRRKGDVVLLHNNRQERGK